MHRAASPVHPRRLPPAIGYPRVLRPIRELPDGADFERQASDSVGSLHPAVTTPCMTSFILRKHDSGRCGPVDGPRLSRLSVKGYRSIDDWLHIDMPKDVPLVLVGENNAGKSNILRALNFLFGDFWPGSYRPEDHEYFGRSPEGNEIKILATVEGMPCTYCSEGSVTQIRWKYAPDDEVVSEFNRASSGCSHTYMNNSIRQSLFCMSVGVNRDLSYQLSYGSKWTTLAKLMRRFHDRLVADPDRVEKLKGIFDTLVATFYEVEEFQTFSDALRNAFADFAGNLRYGLGVDFSAYDPSNYFRSLRVFPHMDGQARTYDELGTGQEQILAMAFAFAYAKAFGGDGLILAVEEPESHLHPLAQQWLARKMKELAKTGVQVIVTTHSPYFVDLAKPWTTVVVRKNDSSQGTQAVQFTPADLAAKLIELGARPELTNGTTVGSFYESAASYETLGAFFSRACILVEGATEHFALPALLERSGLDLLQEGVAVVPVEGLTNMAKWARLYRSYGLVVYGVFDTDTDKAPKDAEASRKAADDLLSALQVRGAPESRPDELGVFERYACFDPNYEAAMRRLFGQEYVHLEVAAAEAVGKSKQLKARYCARRLERPSEQSGWASLATLVHAVRNLLPELSGPANLPPAAVSNTPTGVSRRAMRPSPWRP
jgi:putative ATP-dependent endonuclease of OLD family